MIDATRMNMFSDGKLFSHKTFPIRIFQFLITAVILYGTKDFDLFKALAR